MYYVMYVQGVHSGDSQAVITFYFGLQKNIPNPYYGRWGHKKGVIFG